MASITTRAGKGSPLTNAEVDANFTNLNTELGQKLVASSNLSDLASAAAARTNLGLGNVENKSSATIRSELTSGNITTALGYTPINKSGDTFSGAVTFNSTTTFNQTASFAGQITATQIVNLPGSTTSNTVLGTGATTGTTTIGGTSQTGSLTFGQSTASQTVSLHGGATASTFTKTLNIGTGGLAGSTTSITIGSSAGTSTTNVLGTLQNGGNQVLHAGNFGSYSPSLTGTGASGTWGISITGNAANVTGTVAVANGGTGATDAATARTNLGVAIGSNVQAWDGDLDAIAALAGTSGFLKKTAANTWSLDTSTYLTGNQSITLSGDATGSGATSIAVTLANSGVTAGTYGSATNIPQFAVDAKGRVTSVTNVAVSIPSGSLTFTGDVTGTGSTGSTTTLTLANSGVTAGTYTKVTVDAKGRVTTGASLASADVTTALGFTPYNSTNPSGYQTAANVSAFFGSPGTGGTLDWNDVSNTKPGAYGTLLLGSATNGPGGANYFHPLNLEYASKDGTGNVTQMAVAYGFPGNELYMRGRYNGSWYGWVRFLNSSNYTSYSPSLTGSGASGTWGISISGSAATLTTGRTIGMTGDVTWTSASFNGSANVTGTATLANSGVTAGTYTKVTVDAKGRVTTGAALASADLPTYTGTLTSSQVTTALGYTPYNSTNPNGYTTNTGTVTSVALSLPSIFSVTGSPVTTSGTLTASLASQTANTVLAAPNGSAGAPSFRALVAADIPALTLENLPDAWVKRSVRVATTANITLSGTQTIDGVAVVAGDRVLVKDQTAPADNGIYVVAAGAWSRAADANTATELGAATVSVDSGAANGGLSFDTDFKSTDTLGTTAMTWFRVVDTGLASSTSPAMDGTATVGTSISYARADHVHPTDTSRAATNQTFFLGTTSIAINRASATLALTGITSIDGNAATVTNGVYTTGDQQITGIKNFLVTANSAIGTITTNLSPLEVRAPGTGVGAGAAFMQFHRPNAYAAYFGIDTDNVWKVGGWSAGANAYPILHSNNYNSYAPTLTGTGASGTWSISVTGSAATLTTGRTIGDVSFNGAANIVPERINYKDTRSTDFAPTAYSGATVHLKTNTTDGLSDGGTYHGILHVQQWSDVSGGQFHQLAFTDNGNIWQRTSTSGTAWGSWKKMLDSSNYTSVIGYANSDRRVYTATAGQTTFSVNYTVGFVDVYLNGSKLQPTVEFTATSGTSIVLTAGAMAGDVVDIVAYNAFSVANAYTKSEADALLAAKASLTGSETLTNKTLTDPKISLGGTNGTAGQALVSQGAGLPPVWGSVYTTGDVLTTANALSTPNWLPCNGGTYLKSSYSSLSTLLGVLASESAAYTWTARTIGISTLNDATYGNGLFVAVGSSGALATSPDGITWTSRTSGFGTTTINAVTYGNGLFVAGGVSGVLATSPDGITWTTRTSGFGTQAINAVAAGNGLFVAVGGSGTLTTSSDGITWTSRTSGFGTTAINAVAYGDGLFVAVGGAGTISTSSDGITWTIRSNPASTASLSAITYGNKVFIVVAGTSALISNNGVSWNLYPNFFPASVSTIAYGAGLFLVGGNSGVLYTSFDGVNWNTRLNTYTTSAVSGIAYGNGTYLNVSSGANAATSDIGYDSSTLFAVPTILPAAGGLRAYIKT